MLLPPALGYLSSSTCVGLRYGYAPNNSGFSRRTSYSLRYFISLPVAVSHSPGGFASPAGTPLGPGSPFPAPASRARPHSSVGTQCRNLNLLSIGYGFRPRLRSRLTQGRSALPWKPWIFGRKDSHLTLATHSGILPSPQSTPPYGDASPRGQCSPTNHIRFLSFGDAFQPRTFSARGLSTSELLRTL